MHRRKFLTTVILTSGGLVIKGKTALAMNPRPGEILIRMIYNNTGSCEGLKNAWGLSAWITEVDDTTLFDTGGDPEVLLENMGSLALDPALVQRIVISHDHWDHTGGISSVLEKIPGKVNLYMVEKHHAEFNERYPAANVKGVSEPLKITDHIWSTGPLSTDGGPDGLHEQAVIVINGDRMVLLTGCSHPGIVNLAKRTLGTFPGKKLELVTGGFHLVRTPAKKVHQISAALKELGVERVAPSHCTGGKAIDIFREEWGDRFVDVNLGDQLNV